MDDEMRRRIRNTMGMIRHDCEHDALELDRTAFDPRGVGVNFGNLYAMVDALAKAVEEVLADDA